MTSKYEIKCTGTDYRTGVRLYCVLNPSGVEIAPCLSWRVARKIADLYNADVERRRPVVRSFVWVPGKPGYVTATASTAGAVSLQEEA